MTLGVPRLVRWALAAFAVLGLAALAAVIVLAWTGIGQRYLLEQSLRRLRGAVRGELRVGGISSPGVLGQLTLHGVRIADDHGRPFLMVDSIRARYGLVSLLRGHIVLSELSVWGGDVTVERLPRDDAWNVERIFAPLLERPAPQEPGRRRIAVYGLRLHATSVTVRIPVDPGVRPGARELVEPAPDGEGRLRVLRFSGIEGVAPEFVVSAPGQTARRLRLAELAFTAAVWGDPFRVERVSGDVEIEDTAVAFALSEVRLPGSRLSGRGSAVWAEEDLRVDAEFEASELELADLRWAVPRLPDGKGRLRGRLEMRRDRIHFRTEDVDVAVGASRLRGEFGAWVRPNLRFEAVALQLDPLDLAVVEDVLGRSLPLAGAVRGEVRADGSLGALAVQGRLTLLPGAGAPPSTLEAEGILHLERPYGATDLQAVLAPLEAGAFAALAPAVRLRGPASARIAATGRLDRGVHVTAMLTHTPRELAPSRLEVEGTIRQDRGLVLDLAARAEPLSLTALAHFYPEIPLQGAVRGAVRVQGAVDDLHLAADLETPAGRLAFEGRFDARRFGRHYAITGAVDRFRLSELVPRLQATTVSGWFRIEGGGLSADSLQGTAVAELRRSWIEDLEVDTAYLSLRVQDGIAVVDTASVRTRVGTLEASGRLGLAGLRAADGELRIRVASDSLENLHPLLFGDSLIIQDTLSRIERRALEMRGIDPDTLGHTGGHRVGGLLRAELGLRGSIAAFSAEGRLELRRAWYARESASQAVVRFRADSLPRLDGPLTLELEADSLEFYGRAFRSASARLAFRRPNGALAVLLTRDAREDYRVGAEFQVDSARMTVALSELALRFGDGIWTLEGPATLARDESGIEVRGFRLGGDAARPVRVVAEGNLPSQGAADFRLEVEGLPLARLADLAQLGDPTMGGLVTLRLDISGSARAPEMRGSVAARDLSYSGVTLSAVEGRVDYAKQQLGVQLDAWVGSRKAFSVIGTVPLDLALVDVHDRTPAGPLDLMLRADSFPVATVLNFFEGFQDVGGTLAGAIEVHGTADAPEFGGEMRLSGGAARLDAFGVRYTDVEGTLRLDTDRRLYVDGQVRSRGLARVSGAVRLEALRDPTFDLDVALTGFQAVDRADMTGIVGGRLALRGSYRRPVVTGALQVESGILWLREFQRGRGVVDLSDPALFSVVDTALVTGRSAIAESQNPFVQNLRVDVDLAVRQDTWLRSPDMNVEIAGDLTVSYDRTSRDLALAGELRAARGSYTAFGRHFRVAGGTIEFAGTPGVNPNLGIQAVYRLRTAEGEPLDIMATLGGTLRDPRLTLTSAAQPPISQSDLVSYLIFGRPTYALASGESTVLGRSISRSILGVAAEAAVSTGLGAAASQLESLLAQDFGIDYFSITPTVERPGAAPQGGWAGAFGATQIELGQYISQDVFLVLLYRLSTLSQSQFPGTRLEWRFGDYWTAEAFAEDRFSREPLSGFGELGFRLAKIYGIFVYRDWGY